MTTSQSAIGGPFTLGHPVLRVGASLGAALTAAAWAWLLVANRVPSLEPFAIERNAAGAVLVGALVLVPVCWFRRFPRRIFLSGAVASLILALAFGVAESFFPRLGDRIGAFHVFMLGAVIFGLLAAVDWVANMALAAWREPMVAPRRRLP